MEDGMLRLTGVRSSRDWPREVLCICEGLQEEDSGGRETNVELLPEEGDEDGRGPVDTGIGE